MTAARHRFLARFSFGIATVAAVLAIVTLVSAEWIEAIFGVDPDRGSGALEWAVALGLGVVALVAAAAGRRSVKAAAAFAAG